VFIGLFKRTYTVRQFSPQKIQDGYSTAEYADVKTLLDVQPLNPDELQALPEGERTVKRVKTYGPDKVISADEHSGTPGSLLFYGGLWYECKSSVKWDHTPLGHYRSEFVVLPQREQPEAPEGATANDAK